MMHRIQFSLPWPISPAETSEIFSFAFRTALISYLSFFLLERIRPGFVTTFFNLDVMLWFTVIFGIISNFWPMVVVGSNEHQSRITWQERVWIAVLAIGTMVVVWYKMSGIGWLVSLIAPLCGLLVLGISLLVMYDRDNAPQAPR